MHTPTRDVMVLQPPSPTFSQLPRVLHVVSRPTELPPLQNLLSLPFALPCSVVMGCMIVTSKIHVEVMSSVAVLGDWVL